MRPILVIRPQRCSIIFGSTAAIVRKEAVKFSATTSVEVLLRSVPRSAQLAIVSRRRRSENVDPTGERLGLGHHLLNLVTFGDVAAVTRFRPAAALFNRVSQIRECSSAASDPALNGRQHSASSRAITLPTPRADPVTIATRSFSSGFMGSPIIKSQRQINWPRRSCTRARPLQNRPTNGANRPAIARVSALAARRRIRCRSAFLPEGFNVHSENVAIFDDHTAPDHHVPDCESRLQHAQLDE